MGTDFKCGCRCSGGWYLCNKHENALISLLSDDDEDCTSENVKDKVRQITIAKHLPLLFGGKRKCKK